MNGWIVPTSIVSCLAIGAIFTIVMFALSKGIDGAMAMSSTAVIGALGGGIASGVAVYTRVKRGK